VSVGTQHGPAQVSVGTQHRPAQVSVGTQHRPTQVSVGTQHRPAGLLSLFFTRTKMHKIPCCKPA